jgi:hypothetical protein
MTSRNWLFDTSEASGTREIVIMAFLVMLAVSNNIVPIVVYHSFPSFHSKPSNNISPKVYMGCAMSEHIIQISKITSNRQITIPVEIMKKLRVNVGDKIIWIEHDGDIIVKKA